MTMGDPGVDAASADLMAKAAEPPIPAEKADWPQRLAAAVVDGLLAASVSMIPVVGVLLAALYLLLRDGVELPLLDRQSAGKKLVGLRAVRLDGLPVDAGVAIKRNLMIAVAPVLLFVPFLGWLVAPFLSFLVAAAELTVYFADGEGQRLGDRIAGTHVIVDPEGAKRGDPGD